MGGGRGGGGVMREAMGDRRGGRKCRPEPSREKAKEVLVTAPV